MSEAFKILSDREHILTRPNMYIGAIDSEEQSDFILENDKIEFKNFRIIPGLCKIINEIIDKFQLSYTNTKMRKDIDHF